MKLSEELQWRELIKEKTFEDINWIDTPKKFYLGADGTSNSLTIGNLAIYILARRLMKAGWKAVLLFGGATTLIGDPGGKEEERDLKSVEEVNMNVSAIRDQVKKLFSGFVEGDHFEIVNNYDWFGRINYIDFLRDTGKHFSMTELTQRDYIATRMGEGGAGISYAEFSYNLIQGYDFYHLFKNKEVVLQIGGSDQWGNMLSGVPLIRKKMNQDAHAFSMPLVINKATGKKFGKSEEGAVWLDKTKSSVTNFYQFWINCDDAGLDNYFKVYTFLSKDEIESVLTEHNNNPKKRVAQKILAREVTSLVHGEEEMQLAEAITDYLKEERPISDAEPTVLESLRREIPSIVVEGESDRNIFEILSRTHLAASKTEARYLLENNAISINGVKTGKALIEDADFQNGRLLIRKGKAFKDSALVELA